MDNGGKICVKYINGVYYILPFKIPLLIEKRKDVVYLRILKFEG